MSQEIVIECPHCQVKVRANPAGSIPGEDDEAYFLAQCPFCRAALFGHTLSSRNEHIQGEQSSAQRLWPAPLLAEIAPEIPERARRDINDAQKALSHGIYSATAVLCSRALVRLIKQKAGASMIAKGFADLKAKGVIDQRLFEWAEVLRKERNIGTHASEDDTTKENAQDTLDFTIAIFGYVYTLSEKCEKYMARKAPVEKSN